MKLIGNKSFQAGDYLSACSYWAQGLHVLIRSEAVVPLLCNRSLCFLKLSQLDEALLSAVAAIVCEPTSLKAHYRRAAVLLSMGKPSHALKAVRCGLAVDPSDRDLLAIQHKVQSAVDVSEETATKPSQT